MICARGPASSRRHKSLPQTLVEGDIGRADLKAAGPRRGRHAAQGPATHAYLPPPNSGHTSPSSTAPNPNLGEGRGRGSRAPRPASRGLHKRKPQTRSHSARIRAAEDLDVKRCISHSLHAGLLARPNWSAHRRNSSDYHVNLGLIHGFHPQPPRGGQNARGMLRGLLISFVRGMRWHSSAPPARNQEPPLKPLGSRLTCACIKVQASPPRRALQAFFWLRGFPAARHNPRPPTCH